MLKPSYWLPHRKMARRLLGYPPFSVPARKPIEELSDRDMEINLAFFLEHKNERLQQLIERTSSWEVPVLLGEPLDGIATRWTRIMMRYAGVCGIDPMNQQKFLYRPEASKQWTAGASFMFDVGVWLGEECLRRRPEWSWRIGKDKPRQNWRPPSPDEQDEDIAMRPEDVDEYGSGHGVFWLAGSKDGADPIEACFLAQASIFLGVRAGGFLPAEDKFVRAAKFEYLSRLLSEWDR